MLLRLFLLCCSSFVIESESRIKNQESRFISQSIHSVCRGSCVKGPQFCRNGTLSKMVCLEEKFCCIERQRKIPKPDVNNPIDDSDERHSSSGSGHSEPDVNNPIDDTDEGHSSSGFYYYEPDVNNPIDETDEGYSSYGASGDYSRGYDYGSGYYSGFRGCFGKKDNECTDKSKRCQGWADTGDCRNNPLWMIPNCPKACNLCESCEDQGCFICDNGQCIPPYRKCNNRNDCSDHSDELHCPLTPPPIPRGCPKNYNWVLGSCYQVVAQSSSWPDAQTVCEALNGQLGLIYDHKLFNAYMQTFYDSDQVVYWVGIHSMKGRYTWMNNITLPEDSPLWGSTENPESGADGEDCVVLDVTDAHLATINCEAVSYNNKSIYPVCEYVGNDYHFRY